MFDELADQSSQANMAMELTVPDDLKVSEREMIISALRESNGNRKVASERLGISGRTLRYKLAKYKEQGIEVPIASVA